ncbi:XdhC family protein [Aminithiophilus ramosus]|uniref:XdhC family protein n=2 Tax=Synergistales TaxID=649776 RepID=A0A9Q7ANF9_9BACT|nr:XdhC/CoxI family protein [Aminithiophilus ramosus]QTX32677.1 XdhC family protein [Aminithiophilus ramosus]QVL36552.1 XdhC family protein [Synergistota bacterium]
MYKAYNNVFEAIHEALQAGDQGVLCTLVEEAGSTPRSRGARMWVRPDGSIVGTVGGGVLEHRVIARALEMIASREEVSYFKESLEGDPAFGDEAICGGAAGVFMEYIGQQKKVVIFGGGHVGRALALVAVASGFGAVVWDERDEFANAERFPGAVVHCCPLEGAFDGRIAFDEATFVVIVTRGHVLDGDVARLLEGKKAAYRGMIGSRKKASALKKALLAEGVGSAYLDSIFSPIGLPINAETPEEIALSVMAEIVAVDRGADVKGLRSHGKV